MLQQGRKFTADNLKCLEKKLLGSIYYRMKALGNLGEDLRKWEFTLDWVLSENVVILGLSISINVIYSEQ